MALDCSNKKAAARAAFEVDRVGTLIAEDFFLFRFSGLGGSGSN
jgi:hypothetical protein